MTRSIFPREMPCKQTQTTIRNASCLQTHACNRDLATLGCHRRDLGNLKGQEHTRTQAQQDARSLKQNAHSVLSPAHAHLPLSRVTHALHNICPIRAKMEKDARAQTKWNTRKHEGKLWTCMAREAVHTLSTCCKAGLNDKTAWPSVASPRRQGEANLLNQSSHAPRSTCHRQIHDMTKAMSVTEQA